MSHKKRARDLAKECFVPGLYLLKGWMGVYKFAQVWLDPFSKHVYARALSKLTSANTVDIFRSIVETEKGGHYPDRVLTDRGERFV